MLCEPAGMDIWLPGWEKQQQIILLYVPQLWKTSRIADNRVRLLYGQGIDKIAVSE